MRLISLIHLYIYVEQKFYFLHSRSLLSSSIKKSRSPSYLLPPTTPHLAIPSFLSWRTLKGHNIYDTDVTQDLHILVNNQMNFDTGVHRLQNHFPWKDPLTIPLILKALQSLTETEAKTKRTQIPSSLSGKLRSVKKFQVCLSGQMKPSSLNHHPTDLTQEWKFLVRELVQP